MNKDDLKDEDVAERTGFPVIESEEDEKESDDTEDEETKSEEDEESGEESEEDSDEEEESDESAESDESEEDEEDDSEEEKDEKEEENEETYSRTGKKPRSNRMVPYDLLKKERQENREIRKEIGEIHKVLAEIKTGKQGQNDKTDEEIDEIEKEAAALAEQFGLDDTTLDKDKLTAILRKSVEIAEKRYGDKLPKNFKEKLELLEGLEKQQRKDQEAAHFSKEFESLVPTLKQLYPNASESALKEAKKELDTLAHSKKYHTYDLEDIVTAKNNKKTFDTILGLAPKKKGGEHGKTVHTDTDSDEEEETLTNMENLTPEIMKQREQKEISGRSKRTEQEEDDITIIDPISDE